MNKIEIALGNAIKNCRIKRHLTQIELADLINKSNSTLAKYEKGEISVDVVTLVEISKALQVPLEYFIEAIKEKTEKALPAQADTVIPPFFSSKKLYLYFWDARNNSLNTSVLKILEKAEGSANTYKAEIYMNTKNVDDYIFCENTMLFSTKPLKENDPILKKLIIDKEDIKRLKSNNFFSVTQNW